jgi:hypothetical protein
MSASNHLIISSFIYLFLILSLNIWFLCFYQILILLIPNYFAFNFFYWILFFNLILNHLILILFFLIWSSFLWLQFFLFWVFFIINFFFQFHPLLFNFIEFSYHIWCLFFIMFLNSSRESTPFMSQVMGWVEKPRLMRSIGFIFLLYGK